jgi:outer membrane protein assembly factor BamB
VGRDRTWTLAVALLLIVAGCSSSSKHASSPPTTAAQAPIPADWALPGHDYDNSRATKDSAINAGNVARLHVAWSATVGGSLSTVPIVAGDTIYLQDGGGHVSALDRATGKARWTYDGAGFNIGPFGVALANGLVFAAYQSNGVVALDAHTGKVRWTKKVTSTKSEGLDIQPTVFDGMVYVATVPISVGGIYQGGDRGKVYALDATSGAVRWKFDTIESPDLWGNPSVNSGGGAWYPPAIDPQAGVMYWGVANPAPFPGTTDFPNGSSRPGTNLYTDSTVALDAHTGKLLWYHQVTPHDLFDRDLVHAMIATANGKRVVIGTGKGGVVVGLDPTNGNALWLTPVGTHHNDQLTSLTGPTEIEPGTYGGVLTPPATADGIVYVAAVNSPVTLKPNEVSYFGAQMGQQKGVVVAIDAATGKQQWSTQVAGDPLGGVTVVNNLLFTTLVSGQIVAINRATGTIVWTQTLPGGTNGWMSVVGDTLFVPVGNASPPQLVALTVG